jgi:hypothetical protein
VRAVRAVLAVVKALSPNAQNRCSVYQNGLLQTKKLGSLFRNARKYRDSRFTSRNGRLRLGCGRWGAVDGCFNFRRLCGHFRDGR